jgi:glycosyltransferase involved in cell wall biosynthesis
MINLSIIIPIYNSEFFLDKCLNNVSEILNKSNSIEVILINDGSTDNSYNKIQDFSRNKSNVLIFNKENKGASAARNFGFSKSNGKYIYFVDSDDEFNADVLINLLSIALDKDVEMLGSLINIVYLRGNISKVMNIGVNDFNIIKDGMYFLNKGYQPSSISTFIYKRDFLRNYSLSMILDHTHMDILYTLNCMLHAQKIIFISVCSYTYLLRENSISNSLNIGKFKKYLYDEVLIADKILSLKDKFQNDIERVKIINKVSSVMVWNLLLKLILNKNKLNFNFKMLCLSKLIHFNLYPILSPFHSNFINLTSIFLNKKLILITLFKIK